MAAVAGYFMRNFETEVLEQMFLPLEEPKGYARRLKWREEQGVGVGLSHRRFFWERGLCNFVDDKERYLILEGDVFIQNSILNILPSCLDYIKGSYLIVIVDFSERKIFLISDPLGLRPLYYTLTDQGFFFSSEVKALLSVPGFSSKLDLGAIANMFSLGHVVGDSTLFQDVSLVPPGSMVIFNMDRGEIEIKEYFSLVSLFPEVGEKGKVDPLEVAERFKEAVDRVVYGDEEVGISLSGGLDSRGILACVPEDVSLYSYTLGIGGCSDARVAQDLALTKGAHHTFLEIGEEQLRDFEKIATALIYYSDGMYHPHESTERVALEYLKVAPFKRLLRGHGGEVAKAALAYPVQFSREVEELSSEESLGEYIWKRASIVATEDDLEKVLKSHISAQIKGSTRESIIKAVDTKGKRLSPEDMLLFYYLKQWVRRQVVSSLSVFRRFVDISMPYLDTLFLRELFLLPLEERMQGELHRVIVGRYMPELLKIVDSNTGAPMDAGRVRTFVTEKINSLLKKLNLAGFKHYTQFESWQRKNFRESVESVLFAPKTLDRGFYSAEGMREIFEEHLSGKKNHARLLGSLVGMEIWFRKFMDSDLLKGYG